MYHFRHLGSQLAEIKIAIERMMESDFVTFLMEGLKQRLGSQERSSDQDEQTTEVCVVCVRVCELMVVNQLKLTSFYQKMLLFYCF